MSHIEVIHNALPTDQYTFVKEVFEDKNSEHGTCWMQNFGIVNNTEDADLNHYMFNHMGFVSGYSPTPAFCKVEPYISRLLNVREYLRFKANFYPRTKTIDKHPWHCDDFRIETGLDVKTALLSLSTCNGYTEFKDGTKVRSVENTLILNPNDVEHRGTSTSNANYRINLNINYL